MTRPDPRAPLLALSGIRIIDLTRILSGPFCTMILADMGADLLVMGAYGHSRMREMVFGGATRHIARHMTVPTLLSH